MNKAPLALTGALGALDLFNNSAVSANLARKIPNNGLASPSQKIKISELSSLLGKKRLTQTMLRFTADWLRGRLEP
jgi:hypothetical protein